MEFVYRAADYAKKIVFRDAVVAVHEIPVKSARNNASSRVSQAQRFQFRIAIATYLLANTRTNAVHRFARNLKRYSKLHLADELYAEGKIAAALHYAWQGFCAKPSPGAAMQCIRLWRRNGTH